MFENTRVLITGGTSGIGLATAIAFAEAGARRIALIGRNAERGTEAVRQVAASGAAVKFIQADANHSDQARRAGEEAIVHLGGIDVLVNSTAGAFKPELFHNIPLSDIPDIVTQQLMAPLLMCSAVLPSMRAQKGGLIINIASDAAKVATPGESVIGAAMAAIVMFSRTLAMEAKRDGVRVERTHAVACGRHRDRRTRTCRRLQPETVPEGGKARPSRCCPAGGPGCDCRISRRARRRQDYGPSHQREWRNFGGVITSVEHLAQMRMRSATVRRRRNIAMLGAGVLKRAAVRHARPRPPENGQTKLARWHAVC